MKPFKMITAVAVLSSLFTMSCQNSGSSNNSAGVVVPVGTSVTNCVGVTNCGVGGSSSLIVSAIGQDPNGMMEMQLNFLATGSNFSQAGENAYSLYSGPIAYSGTLVLATTACGVVPPGQYNLQPISVGTYQEGQFAGGSLGVSLGNGVALVVTVVGNGVLVNPAGTSSYSSANRFYVPLQISINGTQVCGVVTVN